MLVVVAVGFFLLVWPQSSHIINRATSLEHTESVETWRSRQHTWQGAMQMARARPLTGWGIGQYAVLQNQYTGDGMPISRIGGASSLGEQAHNIYLQTAAELGISGLLLFVSALAAFVTGGIHRAKQMDAGIRRSLLLGSVAGIVAFAVDAAGNPSWQCGQISMFLWLTLGLGTACMRPLPRRREDVREGAVTKVSSVRFTRPAAVMASLGAVALLPSVSFAVVNLYAVPTSARIFPKNPGIRGGTAQRFQLYVTFSDGVERDVTTENNTGGTSQDYTTFGQQGGQGSMIGAPTTNVYQSKIREDGTRPLITGTYTQKGDGSLGQQSGSVSNGTRIVVHFP